MPVDSGQITRVNGVYAHGEFSIGIRLSALRLCVYEIAVDDVHIEVGAYDWFAVRQHIEIGIYAHARVISDAFPYDAYPCYILLCAQLGDGVVGQGYLC